MHGSTFEWGDDKAAENLSAHRVSFEEATLAVDDPFGIESLDTREAYGEERFVLVGMSQGQLLAVVYTERKTASVLFRLERPTEGEQDDYYRQNAS